MAKKPDHLDIFINDIRSNSTPYAIGCSISFIFCIWIIWGSSTLILGKYFISSDDYEKIGQWGDTFGGFNALFSSIGTIFVAATLYLQFKSNLHQRREIHIQRFEETFFKLIEFMSALKKELEYEQTAPFQLVRPDYKKDGVLKGKDAISAAYQEVNFWVFKNNPGVKSFKKGHIRKEYDNYVHNRFEHCFAPYFRIIYTILYKIRNDPVLKQDEKFYYGNILRAQLGTYEISLIAINGTSKISKDLADLIVYFRLLKYIPSKRRRILGNSYPIEAYSARPE